MENCLFCKIAHREIPSSIVFEDSDVLAFLDIKPSNPGHTIVIPKIHSEDFAAIDPVDREAVFAAAQRIAQGLLQLGAEGVTVLTNVKPASGQTVFHTHVHVVPRYTKDGLRHFAQQDYKPGQSDEWKKKLSEVLRAH